jgi:hypothetical protein
LTQAFYLRDGELFVPTALTRGPWSPDAQHGGPPAALLATAAEAAVPGLRLARLTVDLPRPIPLVPLRVIVTPRREGRRAAWLDLTLADAEGRELARATAVCQRDLPLDLPGPVTAPAPPPASPDAVAPFRFPFFRWSPSYAEAVELRVVEGRWGEGPITAWARPIVDLVAGDPWSAAARVVALADAINGIAPAVPTFGVAFPNADLSVHLRRAPRDGWIGLAARSVPDPAGGGLVTATLYDEAGELGLAVEDLVLSRAG